jgi:hypothetical protein
MQISKTKHVAIVKIVDNQLGPSKNDYSSLGVFGTKPEKGFQIFDPKSKEYEKFKGSKVLFLCKVKYFRTFEPDDGLQNVDRFNREINVKKAIEFINAKEPDGTITGFNHDYCGIIVATLKYDKETGEWYLFVNQGQHRITMAYLVMGYEGEVAVLVDIPGENYTDEELLIREARSHLIDAVRRTGQKVTDKLRSGYICHDTESEEIVNFYNDVGMNVANLLKHEKSCDSWTDVAKYIKDFGRENTYDSMSAIAKYCDEKTIHARAIGGLTAIGHYFKDKVEEFETLNDKDFYKTVCKYAFRDRHRIVKMSNLTKSSGNQKHIAWNMTLWINLVNDMVDTEGYKKKGNSKFWISKTSKCWQNFLETTLQDDPLVEALNQKVEPNVI